MNRRDFLKIVGGAALAISLPDLVEATPGRRENLSRTVVEIMERKGAEEIQKPDYDPKTASFSYLKEGRVVRAGFSFRGRQNNNILDYAVMSKRTASQEIIRPDAADPDYLMIALQFEGSNSGAQLWDYGIDGVLDKFCGVLEKDVEVLRESAFLNCDLQSVTCSKEEKRMYRALFRTILDDVYRALKGDDIAL